MLPRRLACLAEEVEVIDGFASSFLCEGVFAEEWNGKLSASACIVCIAAQIV